MPVVARFAAAALTQSVTCPYPARREGDIVLHRLWLAVGYCVAVCILATLPFQGTAEARGGKAALKAHHARATVHKRGKRHFRGKRLHRRRHARTAHKARHHRMTRRERLRRARLARKHRKYHGMRKRSRLARMPHRASSQPRQAAIVHAASPQRDSVPPLSIKADEKQPAPPPAPPVAKAMMPPLLVPPPAAATPTAEDASPALQKEKAAPPSAASPAAIGQTDEIMAVEMLIPQDAATSAGGYW